MVLITIRPQSLHRCKLVHSVWISVFFSSTTTKTKIFVDENKLIFITKTTTTNENSAVSADETKIKTKIQVTNEDDD